MDKEYFLNAGIQPPLQFEHTMQAAWNSFSSAQELNCSSDQASTCFMNPIWDSKKADHYPQLDSTLSSIVSSSPVAPHSAAPTNDALALRELIRKLGPICNSGDMSQPFPAATMAAAVATSYAGNANSNTSGYSSPLNSPPNLHVPLLDKNLPNLRNTVPLNPSLPALSTDPGFVERAAKFSCFGSRSFNGRTTQFGINNAELPYRSNTPTMESGKLPRISSSPSLKQGESPMENKNLGQSQIEMRPANDLLPGSDNKFNKLSASRANSNEKSSVSEQLPSGETGLKTPNELNFRKRKAVARGKAKEDASSQAVSANKGAEADADTNAKRSKPTEANASQNCGVKTEVKPTDSANKTGDDKANQKPPEPPKDYIHVRARRGQATDSHSLAERVRREKISERMKLLQDLVPGCNKVTGKALMLDEIINYVQSLQSQVEFLSMKLASVNPRLDNMDNLLSKDVFQPNASLPHTLFPTDSSGPTFHKNPPQQTPQLHNNGSMDQVDTTLFRNLGLQLPPLDGFSEGLPQFPTFCGDDLQSFVQMGFSQNPDREAAIHSKSFPIAVANQTSHMKLEL